MSASFLRKTGSSFPHNALGNCRHDFCKLDDLVADRLRDKPRIAKVDGVLHGNALQSPEIEIVDLLLAPFESLVFPQAHVDHMSHLVLIETKSFSKSQKLFDFALS